MLEFCSTKLSTLSSYLTYNAYTHTRLTALCPGLPGWAGTRKVKTIWILLKQETVSGSGISWAICKSAPRSRQITTPAPFLQAGCPSCRPTNSVKALKAIYIQCITWQKTKVVVAVSSNTTNVPGTAYSSLGSFVFYLIMCYSNIPPANLSKYNRRWSSLLQLVL